jgi:carbonic anhydrase
MIPMGHDSDCRRGRPTGRVIATSSERTTAMAHGTNFGALLPDCCTGHSLSRRHVLRGGAAGLLAGACAGLAGLRPASAQSVLTPDAALQQMMDGNQRFVDKRLTSFEEDLHQLKANTAEKQEPFAAVLACADSRVPVELVFDQSIGQLFVARVAGNIASPEIIASLEYGVAVLHTKVIMVMGHANCGAVKAALAGKAVPGQISALYSYLRPAVDQAGSDLDAAIRANARIQAKLLAESSPVLVAAIKAGTLKIVASHYALATGKTTLLS